MNKTQTPRQVLNLPAGYFGMVLGTIGMRLRLALRQHPLAGQPQHW